MARNSTYALLMSMVSALGRKTVPIQEGSRKSRTHREERGYSTGACVLWVPPVLPIIAKSWMGGGVRLGTALSSLGKGTGKRHAEGQSAETSAHAHTSTLTYVY